MNSSSNQKTNHQKTLVNLSALQEVGEYLNITKQEDGEKHLINLQIQYSSFELQYYEIKSIIEAIEILSNSEHGDPKAYLSTVSNLATTAVRLIEPLSNYFELLDSVFVPFEYNKHKFGTLKPMQ